MKSTIHFTKMHGAGNDYIYVWLPENPIADLSAASIAWSRPHFGIGSDGLIAIDRSEVADFSMRIFNADGSEAKMCGNGIRCVGKFVRDHGLTDKQVITVDTLSGVKTIALTEDESGEVNGACVDMGVPVVAESFTSAGLPEGVSVSMGNPHYVIFVDDIAQVVLEEAGKALEHHPAFPGGCNIEFAEVRSDGTIRMRVWERGSGITLACGTGACATVVAAMSTGRVSRSGAVSIEMDGGWLSIAWNESDGHVMMTGPAARVFEGTLTIDNE